MIFDIHLVSDLVALAVYLGLGVDRVDANIYAVVKKLLSTGALGPLQTVKISLYMIGGE